MASFRESLASNSDKSVKWIYLKNRHGNARASLNDINSNKTLFDSLTVSINKCDGNCNTIDDPDVRVCDPNKVKTINIKVFNLILGVNETKFFCSIRIMWL